MAGRLGDLPPPGPKGSGRGKSGGGKGREQARESDNIADDFMDGVPVDFDDLDRQLAAELKNDMGNANRLRARFGRDLLFVKDVGWHVYDGQRWNLAQGERMVQLRAHETAVKIMAEADAMAALGPYPREKNPAFVERIGKHKKWSIASGNSARLGAMVREVQPYLSAEIEDMDCDTMMVNVANGTLRLGAGFDGLVELCAHDRADKAAKVMPVDYDPEALCPVFDKFLARIMPDADLRGFLQRWFGYTLTGDISEQCLVLFHGKGSNGKSTLMDLLVDLFGDYALILNFASLLHDDRKRGSEASPDLARLPGARLVAAAEPEVGARFSESTLKSLTGGERIAVRHLNKDFFEFKPQFKLVLSFNNRPAVRGQDEGIWRRLLLVPFDQYIPPAERDRGLAAALRSEAPGILNWLLDGFRAWFESGLQVPDAVRAATNAYRTDSDPIAEWLAARTVPAEQKDYVTAKALYSDYVEYCKESATEPVSQTRFGKLMTARGYERDTVGIVYYRGLKLLSPIDDVSG